MNATPILPEDDPASFPSMPTLHGGDPNTLGRIDHYDLLRKLGGGGFGVVYLARDSVSGIEVALKTLHPLLKTNAEEMDALREKFRLVHGLTHPNIAKALVLHPVRDVNIWDETARKEMRLSPGDSVMVMDYAPGVTLSKWRRQFPDGIVPPDLALEIGRQLASALDYAHGERIVHRDIKPGNIMVETLRADEPRGASDHEVDAAQCAASGRQDDEKTRRQGPASETVGGRGSISRHPVIPSSRRPPHVRVRLLDFGLAAEIRSSMSRVSTETGDTSGTRPYMAPEQWLGRKQDGRTDQYALACVLYEMLSGAPPFAGVFESGDPMIMKDAVVRDAPEEIEDAPKAVNAALLRALSKIPKERFPSCADFVAALDGTTKDTKSTKADAGRDAPTARPGGASRVGEPRRRRGIVPWLLGAAAAVAVVVAVDHVRNASETSSMEVERKAREEAETEAERIAQEKAKLEEDISNLESAIAAYGKELEEAEAETYAAEEFGRAKRTREEAVQLRGQGDLASARDKFTSAKALYEEALETARRKRQEAADEKIRADLKRLKDAAEKTVQNVAQYRKWADDWEFQPLFSALDAEKAVLDALLEASDFDKAVEAARRLRDTASSIRSKGRGREVAEADRKASEEEETKSPNTNTISVSPIHFPDPTMSGYHTENIVIKSDNGVVFPWRIAVPETPEPRNQNPSNRNEIKHH